MQLENRVVLCFRLALATQAVAGGGRKWRNRLHPQRMMADLDSVNHHPPNCSACDSEEQETATYSSATPFLQCCCCCSQSSMCLD
uniref:Putative secreted peptide n=1 Tax=Anopheles braziliensis TaxID=58242 RepID=A0A2M3ZX27_9DIPT